MQTQEQQQSPAEITVDHVMDVVTYEGFVRKLFNRSGDPATDFSHAMLGVSTEIYELLGARDGVNALEEMGDLEFYLVALQQVLIDHFGAAAMLPSARLEIELLAAYPQIAEQPAHLVYPLLLNELQDIGKRWIGYNKAPTMSPVMILTLAAAAVNAAAHVAVGRGSFKEEHIRRTNVGKLLLRYKGMTFSQDSAINRDLGAERALLNAAAESASA